jgi:hypothetical protein
MQSWLSQQEKWCDPQRDNQPLGAFICHSALTNAGELNLELCPAHTRDLEL